MTQPRMSFEVILKKIKKPELLRIQASIWRRHPDLNWGIKVLQTSALPLGYGAVSQTLI